jgi:hypothetical protein
MSTLTRNRAKFEENEKNNWIDKYEEHLQFLRTPSSSPAEYFKKRNASRPPLINLKKFPNYSSDLSFYNNRVIYFLELALLFMINSENLQLWHFEDEYLKYLYADFTCIQRADGLVMRLYERFQNPDIPREPVDDFLDEIGEPIRLIVLHRQDVPPALKFAVHILSLEGSVQDRLMLHSAPSELEAFINKVVGEKIFEEPLCEPLSETVSETLNQSLSGEDDDYETSGPDKVDEKPVVIIDLLNDDEDEDEDDLTKISRKRTYEEIIDLTFLD